MSHSAIDTGGQSTTEQVTRQAQDAAGQVADKAREATAQARQQAAQTTRQAKGMLRGQVDQRSTQLGQQVTGQAADMRSVAEQLRQQGKDTPARVAERLAGRAEQVGGYLQISDADQILDDVEDFVRSNPWAVAAGALGLGFAAARFLKASSSRRYQAGSDQSYASRRDLNPPL